MANEASNEFGNGSETYFKKTKQPYQAFLEELEVTQVCLERIDDVFDLKVVKGMIARVYYSNPNLGKELLDKLKREGLNSMSNLRIEYPQYLADFSIEQ